MKYLTKSLSSLVLGGALAMLVGLGGSAQASPKVVNVAYQATYSPWIEAMVDGKFEKATGYEIHWKKFNSGAAVMSAMASGDIDIGVLGSPPLTAAVSRGMDIQVFWILENIANAEALMVRDGAHVKTPQDLAGKTIAVPFASTSHYQLMYMLDKWGIADKVRVINMSPEQAAAAWQRGDIDAAFIWGPALGRIRKTGHSMMSAGQICALGRCTFEGMAVTKGFGGAHPQFMSKFVGVINAANQDYHDHPDAWRAGSKNIGAVIRGLGGDANDAVEEMALYQYPSLKEQVSCQWLGCGAQGGVAKTLQLTAEFLKQQKKIDTVKSNYSDAVAPRYAATILDAAKQ